MAFNKLQREVDYPIYFIAGDTEFVRITVKDDTGAVIDVSTDVAIRMGIKRDPLDDEFIVPEKLGTTFVYDAVNQTYTIEVAFTSDDTVSILTYGGKNRKSLKAYYDIELHNTHLGADERTTILAGTLSISRSISGRV